jgi:hypothetical protein
MAQPRSAELPGGRSTWWGISLAVLVLILFFGLNPRDFRFANGAAWMPHGPGLRFDKYGIAFTERNFPAIPAPDLSIEVTLKTLSSGSDGFSLILAFHDGEDDNQLILGQWRNWLIVMNGDDYAHRRRLKRLSTSIENTAGKKITVTITSSDAGARIYIDGAPVSFRRDTVFTVPNGRAGTRLVVGNSVYGKHSWNGAIYDLSIFRSMLTAEAVNARYQSQRGSGTPPDTPAPVAHYSFGEGKGPRARDSAGSAHLFLPSGMTVLKKQFLAAPVAVSEGNTGLIQDFLLNLLGFIPLGFTLFTMLSRTLPSADHRRRLAAAVVGLGFAVSLLIETVQVWIPSRNSSVTDLLLNTLGTMVGIAICLWTSPQSTTESDVSTDSR